MKSTYKNNDFKLVVISNPSAIHQEFDIVNQMFEEGMECFHLRKPGLNKSEYLKIFQLISPRFLKRVMIHDHFSIALKYNIKGFHLKNDVLQRESRELELAMKAAKKKGLLLSSSIHGLDELPSVPKIVDYLFLSPVFDSISKPGYQANVNLKIAENILKSTEIKSNVVALGGMDSQNLNIINKAGFDGAAILGAIWQSKDPFLKFKQLKNQILEK